MERYVMGGIFILGGLWYFFTPVSVFNLKKRWSKLFGITMTSSKKTLLFYKYFGIVFFGLGCYLFLTA